MEAAEVVAEALAVERREVAEGSRVALGLVHRLAAARARVRHSVAALALVQVHHSAQAAVHGLAQAREPELLADLAPVQGLVREVLPALEAEHAQVHRLVPAEQPELAVERG